MAQTAAVERTLALIKPDAVDKAEDIIDAIRNAGFTILQVSVSVFRLYLCDRVTRSNLGHQGAAYGGNGRL